MCGLRVGRCAPGLPCGLRLRGRALRLRFRFPARLGLPVVVRWARGRAPTPRAAAARGRTPCCRRRRPRRHCHRRDRRGRRRGGVATRSTQRRLGDQPDAHHRDDAEHDEREGLGAVRVHGTRARSACPGCRCSAQLGRHAEHGLTTRQHAPDAVEQAPLVATACSGFVVFAVTRMGESSSIVTS